MKGDKGYAGPMGAKGRKGDPGPYQLSEDRSSIVELVGVSTLRCVSVYHEPVLHFHAKDAKDRKWQTCRKSPVIVVFKR